MRTSNTQRQLPQPEFRLQAGLDALVCGDVDEDEFVREALALFDSKSSTYLISCIDQYYQRGQLPEPLFRSIKAKITQQVLARAIHEVDDVVGAEATAAAPPPASIDEPSMSAAPRSNGRGAAAPPASAASAVPQAALGFGQLVHDRYTVHGLLGRGAMTEVYSATDEQRAARGATDRLVALKVLQESNAGRPELRDAFRREFDRMRKLAHPNIVKVYDFEQDDSILFYTMEVLDGQRLSDLIERTPNEPLPRAYAWAIIRSIGAALAHAHAREVIHGDVSARNVLIGAGGELRVLAFGSPGAYREARPAYASCEVLEGQPADARDDLFALACLACELLGGAHPFRGFSAAEARDRGTVARRPRGMDLFQWRTLRRGLSWSREGRPDSIRQWLAELGLEPEPARLPPMDQDIQRKPVMRVQHVAFAAALLICAVLGYFLVWHSIDRITGGPVPAIADTAATTPAPVPAPELKPNPAEAPIAAADSGETQDADSQPHPAKAANTAPAAATHPTIKFAAKRFAVAPGTGFAEIHVWRSRPAPDLSDFMWWTEDASAHSGVDFVAQDRTTHPFAHKSLSATIFVKILPRTDRTRSASFKVCAGKASGDAANEVTCSAVVLPARG